MMKMMIFVYAILGLVIGPVLIQACSNATVTPQCHITSDCTDPVPANIAPCGDCCSTTGRNSFRKNSLGYCVPCVSKGCHIDSLGEKCSGTPELPGIDSLAECCGIGGTSFLGDDGICVFCSSVCYLDTGTGSGCNSSQTAPSISFNECCLNSTNNYYSFNGTDDTCTPCNSIGCHSGKDCDGDPEFNTTQILTCCDQTLMTGSFRNEYGECFCLNRSTDGPNGCNDPHFFIPLTNGDNLCFSIQGQPDFMFSLIKDEFVQLNALFVLPAKDDESETIANVSTFMGKLGLSLQCPLTGQSTNIQVSAQDHSVSVADAVAVVKNRVVTVKVSKHFDVSIVVDGNVQSDLKRDESALLNIISDFGFELQVRFYKKHLNFFVKNTDILTKKAHGLLGQFLASSVEIDPENNLMKLNGRRPIPVRYAQAWPFLNNPDNCWYGANTDNQATGMIDGVYTDYIVETLLP